MFHWFEIAIFVCIIWFLCLLIHKKVMPARYFYPVLLGFWAPMTAADFVVGESLGEGLGDLFVLILTIGLLFRERQNASA